MGLIMLILIGTVPMAYAFSRPMPVDHMPQFVAMSQVTRDSLIKSVTTPGSAEDSLATLSEYVRTKEYKAEVLSALANVIGNIGDQVKQYESFASVPSDMVSNVRNDMYLTSESIRFLEKNNAVKLDADTKTNLKAFKKDIDDSTKFIPLWVKVVVAIALGLGTMVGWKRIVVTVGEKIGKTHLTYAQGASAELVAMMTIGAADMFGLPVSTTQVLSSGVAGAMTANKSGLQWGTIRHLAMAWVLTLPVAMLLSGSLYWLFSKLF
jgi:PiT family inorganic phosphate transporter